MFCARARYCNESTPSTGDFAAMYVSRAARATRATDQRTASRVGFVTDLANYGTTFTSVIQYDRSVTCNFASMRFLSAGNFSTFAPRTL